jgi:hypothetical protein
VCWTGLPLSSDLASLWVNRYLSLSMGARYVPVLTPVSGMLPHETIWMQTTGAMLLTVRRCSLACTWMLAQGSKGMQALLYFAAVRRSRCECERRHRLAKTLSKSARLSPAKVN